MKQYCRYCTNLCYGDVAYCKAHDEVRSIGSCKRPNNCKDFDLCQAEPPYQDAFGENMKSYNPREKKDDGEQITW